MDALADNEPLDAKAKRKSSTLEGEAALYANSSAVVTLSIDLPSGVDPDTGTSLAQTRKFVIRQQDTS